MITILSVPRTGTRFWYYFATRVLKQRTTYAHFSSRTINAIGDFLREHEGIVIVPVRDDDDTISSARGKNGALFADAIRVRNRFMPQLLAFGAFFMDTVKNKDTRQKISELIDELGIEWSPEIEQFVEEWKPIGSQFSDDVISEEILLEMLRCKTLCHSQPEKD